jgi:hypothetical protein
MDEVARLLEYLRERDVPCPLCNYNLRNLTRPQCPECRQDLTLTVGVTRPRLLWLLATVAPSMFSGIAAGLLLIPMILAPLLGGEGAPWQVLAAESFGWLSAAAAIVLVGRRYAFLRQPQAAQRRWAVGAWLIHVAAFFLLLASLFFL